MGLATAEEISMDGAAVEVLSEVDGNTEGKKRTALKALISEQHCFTLLTHWQKVWSNTAVHHG